MNTAAAVIAVCLLACLHRSNGQLVINTNSGDVTGSAEGVTWVEGLNSGSPGVQCSRQGLVKLTFEPGVRDLLVLILTFASSGSEGFTFDLGDSDTNNGYAGDAATYDNDAEVHTVGSSLYFYGRDLRPGLSSGLLREVHNFVGVAPNLNLRLEVQDQQLEAFNGVSDVKVQDRYMYQLKGQPDAGGVNYDVYFSMNRVISSNYRSGTGLCSVSIQFFRS